MQATWLHTDARLSEDELDAEGIFYEHLSTDPAAHQGSLDALKARRGYMEQDVVELGPTTPNLDVICAKFAGEHLHNDDEVRFVLDGEGVFFIRSSDDAWMRVLVEPGDLIVVPAGRHHRFELTQLRSIRCVRLFKDTAGWVPHYRSAAA